MEREAFIEACLERARQTRKLRYVAPDHDEYSPIPSDHVYPQLEHVSATKLGGHPSWMQDPDWPVATSGRRMEFGAQLDMSLCRELAWASGIALLFGVAADPRAPEVELVVQTS